MIKNISSVSVNAMPEKLWDVLTKPELVKLWQYGSELITDWKPGSIIKFKTEREGKIFEQWGKVLEIKPYQLIKYTLFAPRPGLEDKPENYFIMNYILSPENDTTRLDIVQEDGRPNAVQEPPQGDENPVLLMLKNVAEEKE